MSISKNKVVSLTYELRENDGSGDLIEMVNADQPFIFLFGAGGLLPEFESNLEGKIIGSTFDFKIGAANAYGEVDEGALEFVPKDIFMIDGQIADDLLQIDKIVNLRDEGGKMIRARVAEVGDAEVLLDFNHPLAGVNLFFKGEILDIREASPEEIQHGHVHGEGGHHH